MTRNKQVSAVASLDADLRTLVRNIGYEVMPFKGIEESVARFVPRDVPLTVTTTEAKGIDSTVDLTQRLRDRGYVVAPHLAARLFRSEDEVISVVERLQRGGIDRVFVIGGDAASPAGPFHDALALLEIVEKIGHHFTDVGIGGYPEGHGQIPAEAMDRAVRAKAAYATRIVTQICFDAKVTVRWAHGLNGNNISLPVYVGMPGPVNMKKLIRISAGIGLGQSARFLQKQNGLWRFLLPGAYNPSRLARQLGDASSRVPSSVRGLHIFTFNELERTEEWRRALRMKLDID